MKGVSTGVTYGMTSGVTSGMTSGSNKSVDSWVLQTVFLIKYAWKWIHELIFIWY